MSCLDIFCVYKKINYMSENNEYDNFRDIFKPPFGLKNYYDNTPKYLKNQIIRINSEIESGFYSAYDAMMVMFKQLIFGNSVDLEDVCDGIINKHIKEFSGETLKYDENTIFEINRKYNLDLIDYFKINDNGFSLVHSLVIEGAISVFFEIHYKKILTEALKNTSFFYIERGMKRHNKIIDILSYFNDKRSQMNSLNTQINQTT